MKHFTVTLGKKSYLSYFKNFLLFLVPLVVHSHPLFVHFYFLLFPISPHPSHFSFLCPIFSCWPHPLLFPVLLLLSPPPPLLLLLSDSGGYSLQKVSPGWHFLRNFIDFCSARCDWLTGAASISHQSPLTRKQANQMTLRSTSSK